MDGMSRLTPSTRLHLERRLAGRAGARPFAEAVAAQLAHPPGRRGDEAAERAAVDRIAGMLELATVDGVPDEAEVALLGDPWLLSAAFQNLDLLFGRGFSPADDFARLLARLVDRAEEAG